MERVAKLIIIDPRDEYLLMERSDHPTYGNDTDLPGGTIEDNESIVEGLLREVQEEAGIAVEASRLRHLYAGYEYSDQNMQYVLYAVRLTFRPKVILSWEHASYEWVDRETFLSRAASSKDSYMHMVSEVVRNDSVAANQR